MLVRAVTRDDLDTEAVERTFARATWTGMAEPGDGTAGALIAALGPARRARRRGRAPHPDRARVLDAASRPPNSHRRSSGGRPGSPPPTRCSRCGRPRGSGCGCAHRRMRRGTARSTTSGCMRRSPCGPGARMPRSPRSRLDRARRGPGRHRLRRARHDGVLGGPRRSRIRDRLGCRVRHRRHGAPGRARQPRHHGGVPRRRRRPLLPERPRRAAHPHRRGGVRRLRAALRLAADEVALPAAQPADRRREPGDGRARGGLALGFAQHRASRRRARAARSARCPDR